MSDHSDLFEAHADALGHLLAETSTDFVCLATARGEPFYLNPAARSLLGLEEGQATSSLSLRDFYASDSWTELRDVAVPAVNKTGRWEGHSRLRKIRGGEPIEVQTTMLRVKSWESGRLPFLCILHRHADDRTRLRAALAEVQAGKRAILESSLDPIIAINHQGIITEYNQAAVQVFGYPRERVLGTKPSDVLFPPGMSVGQQDRLDRYLEAGEGSMAGKRIEVTAVRANGEIFDAEMALVISHELGAPVLTFFVRDVSARKKAEQEQARYAAELERSNRELEQFAYVASHDMQEPLRKIRAFGDRLRARCGDKLDEVGHECLQRMLASAERMQVFVEGLLSLSRVTAQGQRFARVDLAQVAREVVTDLESQIEQVQGRVEIGHLPTIEAVPLQIRQLLQNLIANGLKFHREGEPPVVKVHGKFVHGRNQRMAGQPAVREQCRILVEDNGIGLEEKHQEHIFGVFQRLHHNLFEGAGIGLALCRKIAECHGGQITARGVPGRGSVFEVVLPVIHPKKGTAAEVLARTAAIDSDGS